MSELNPVYADLEAARTRIRELESKLSSSEERIRELHDLGQQAANRADDMERERDSYALRLDSLVHILRNAQRIGAETDIPEGSRYIQLSDTLVAEMLADNLRHGPMTSGSVRVVERHSDNQCEHLNCEGTSARRWCLDCGVELPSLRV